MCFKFMASLGSHNGHCFDQRDTLILALSALLKAERETRIAFETCLGAGVLSPETLQAIISDPVPVITQEDVAYAESVAMNQGFEEGTR